MTTSPPALVRYGRPGFVGRFRTAVALARGDRVVIRSQRGMELGEVLLATADGTAADGDVVRLAGPEDEATAAASDERGRELLAAAESTGADLPLAFVDAEVTLDGVAILHALPWDACDATELLDSLGAKSGLTVRLLDLSRTPVPEEPASKGCGKPGCGTESGGCSSGSCGTGSGGCSTGSCSRGAVKSADELTAHFADLRQKMEAAGLARTPLN